MPSRPVPGSCLLSSRQRREVLQELKADCLTLLRVELRREEILAPDHRREPDPVLGRPRRHRGVHRLHVVGMDEVEERLLGQPGQDGRRPLDPDPVPPHVRDLQPAPAAPRVGHVVPEPDHPTRKQIHTPVEAELLALGEQEVQAQADPQDRLAPLDLAPERLHETASPQLRDPVGKSPHPGEDDPRRLPEPARIVDDGRLGPDRTERLLHAAEVGNPRVDDGDHVRPSSPSSMGSRPPRARPDRSPGPARDPAP